MTLTKLQNEVSQYIPGYVLANSGYSVELLEDKARLTPPDIPPRVLKAQSWKGKDVVICGAGPSLTQADELLKSHVGPIWGCNSALTWLVNNGYRVTHGVAIDQTDRMYSKVWKDPPDVTYYLATSVDPGLPKHLKDFSVSFFHSFNGFEDEYELYGRIYPESTIVAGNGLNVVNRALDVAVYLGFQNIYICGTDCALGPDLQLYAHGNKIDDDRVIATGTIDGREWRTTLDMLASAVALVSQRKELGKRIQFVGDTLPNALRKKPQTFLDRCIRWASEREVLQET